MVKVPSYCKVLARVVWKFLLETRSLSSYVRSHLVDYHIVPHFYRKTVDLPAVLKKKNIYIYFKIDIFLNKKYIYMVCVLYSADPRPNCGVSQALSWVPQPAWSLFSICWLLSSCPNKIPLKTKSETKSYQQLWLSTTISSTSCLHHFLSDQGLKAKESCTSVF